MSLHIGGLVAIFIFYGLILIIGLWAARKTGFRVTHLKLDDAILANRSLGLVLGSFTMTATWVGGGYVNGTAETVAVKGGLVWCQAPLGYALSLIVGGFFFVDTMRESGFNTLLDPFQQKYGDIMNCLLFLPALCGDIFWSAAILNALGASLKVILELDLKLAVVSSAVISCVYTLLGGLYSVAYTDVVQLICMFLGLWLCVPFSITHHAVEPIFTTSHVWLGQLEYDEIGTYIDYALLLIMGGIPWQVYWQRALAARSSNVARWLSYVGGIGCAVMSLPSIVMGAVAASTNWNQTDYHHPEVLVEDQTLILPMVIRFLCPSMVAIIGLGAVSAAVMSSTDSAVLASSSMFSRNVVAALWERLNKTEMSDTAQVWIMRASQVVITGLSCLLALKVNSIYGLWVLCSDFVYVTLFPQLVCVLFAPYTNSYGSIAAFFLGLFFRISGGDSSLQIPVLIKYPWFRESDQVQLFPFRTLSMLVTLFCLLGVSHLTRALFTRQLLPLSWDLYGCFQHLPRRHKETDGASSPCTTELNLQGTTEVNAYVKKEPSPLTEDNNSSPL